MPWTRGGLTVLVMLLFGFAAFKEVIRLLSIVQEMALSSKAITAGDYERPELSEHRKDEIGDMARAFNEMKRAMRNQVRLLTAHNEMEKELHRKNTEALAMQICWSRRAAGTQEPDQPPFSLQYHQRD